MTSLLRGHHAQERLGVELAAACLRRRGLNAPLSSKPISSLVVLGLAQLDLLGREDFLEREEVQRLAVAKHAVEIEQHRVRPAGHAWGG